MGLAIGARLGVYEVTAQIGEGGMGQVYRARDTKLGRDVALKILPESFASDPERLARFEREARTLASLNHPNIATIYGFEEANQIKALVMELVEGPTLADVIADRSAAGTGQSPRGSAPSGGSEARQAVGVGPRGILIDEAVDIARQIADALETAHEHGIIHRDLKPANVKVREDGTVKVLDFGLAKLTQAQGLAGRSQEDLTQSPTITSPAHLRQGYGGQAMTGVGVLLGTAAYMSPEQAKGRAADNRSDVWSFGVVLYEMLSGRRPFDGEDIGDTLASVLKSDPDWTRLPADVPLAIRTLVQRCLVKDRRHRIADISVAQFLLSEHASLAAAAPAPPAADRGSPRSRWTRAFPLTAAVVLTALVVGAGVWSLRPPLPSPTVAQFSLVLSEGVTFGPSGRQLVAISPDGTELVYVANNRLYLRPIGELEARVIPGADLGVSSPVFSPDGRSIAYFSTTDDMLKRISVSGGTAETIAPASNPFGMSWDVDGIVVGQGTGGIVRVSPAGGSPEQIVSVGAGEYAHTPQMLPGGRAILFAIAPVTGGADRWDRAQVVVQSLTSGTRLTVINGGAAPRYLPSGHLVYAMGGTVYAIAFDPEKPAVSDGSVPVVVGVRRSLGNTGLAQFAASDTGSLVYVPGPAQPTSNLRELVLADRKGATTPLQLPPKPYIHPRVSPDGTRVAVGQDDLKEADIWVFDVAGTSAMRRLTFGGHNRFPVWSADSRRVTYQSARDGDRSLFWQSADGGREERLTTADKGDAHLPESWSPDGKHLLFSIVKGSSFSLWVLSVEDKKAVSFGDVRGVERSSAVFSPDGRWVAYTFNDISADSRSPNRGVYIQPFPATGARYQLPKRQFDYHPAWMPGGQELLYVPGAGSPTLAVPVRTQPNVTFGTPVELPAVPRPRLFSMDVRGYDILPDGRFISVVPASDENAASSQGDREMRVVLNWFEELKRRVPTR